MREGQQLKNDYQERQTHKLMVSYDNFLTATNPRYLCTMQMVPDPFWWEWDSISNYMPINYMAMPTLDPLVLQI